MTSVVKMIRPLMTMVDVDVYDAEFID